MRGRTCSLIAALALPAVVFAHHSFAQFDTNKVVDLNGTMRALEWQNPHSWIWIDVTKPDGSVESWGGEFGGGPSTLPHDGFTRKTVLPGDKIVLSLYPARDGSKAGSVAKITTASGQVITFQRPAAPGPASGPAPGGG